MRTLLHRMTSAALIVAVLTLSSGCLDTANELPPAQSGNIPAGAVAEDEPPVSSSYVQTESRTPIEYTGSSN